MDLEFLLLEKVFGFFVWLFIFRDRPIGNFPDPRGGGLACHGEPFDMLLWRRILEQIKCLKDSGMNSTPPNHQIPFLCNIL